MSGCVLFDPVDGSPMTPESADYPSATKALAAAGRAAGLVGAAITGSCNPVGQNYPKFWGALAPGSWQMVINQVRDMVLLVTETYLSRAGNQSRPANAT